MAVGAEACEETMQEVSLQDEKTIQLLTLDHASRCRSPRCTFKDCGRVKGLFRHGMECNVRASGDCILCKKMWYLLHIHAQECRDSECHIPRCSDLKEHFRKQQQEEE